MFQPTLAIVSLALIGVGHAHVVTRHWQAQVIEKACFVTVRSGTDFLDRERYGDRRDIEIDFSFSTPHPGIENIFAHLPNVNPAPVLVIAQFLPAYIIQDNKLEFSEVVSSGGENYAMILDTNQESNGLPTYLLGGKTAQTIWTRTQNGESLNVSFVLGGTEQLSIDVPRKNFGVAQVMHSACVTQVAEHGLN